MYYTFNFVEVAGWIVFGSAGPKLGHFSDKVAAVDL